MDRQLIIKHLMEEDLDRLVLIKGRMSSLLGQLPKGSITERNGKLYHSYRNGGKQHMVLIRDPQLLNSLRVRRCIIESLPKINVRIDNCRHFIENDVIFDTKKVELELPDRYRAASEPCLWLPGDVDPVEWANADYVSNPAEIKNPNYTGKGRVVRSKSESIIGTEIEDISLLHRYEEKLVICGEVFYPDFSILLPYSRRIAYYEHFGKMDDPEYVMKTIHKLEMYPKGGLYLGVNFFATFETQMTPFAVAGARKMIEEILKHDRK